MNSPIIVDIPWFWLDDINVFIVQNGFTKLSPLILLLFLIEQKRLSYFSYQLIAHQVNVKIRQVPWQKHTTRFNCCIDGYLTIFTMIPLLGI